NQFASSVLVLGGQNPTAGPTRHMTGALDRNAQSAGKRPAPAGGDAGTGSARVPVCLVVDEEPRIRHFLSLILHGAGLETEEFSDGASFRAAVAQQESDLAFIDVGLDSSEAIHRSLRSASAAISVSCS